MTRRPIRSGDHQPLKRRGIITGSPSSSTRRSPRCSPARSAGLPPRPGGSARRRSGRGVRRPPAAVAVARRPHRAGPAGPALADQRRDDRAGDVVDRDRQADARCPATAVLIPTTRAAPSTSAPPELPGLSAASVWITFSTMRRGPPRRPDRERTAQSADHAGGDRAGEPLRIADRHHELADPQGGGVAERPRRRSRPPRRAGRRDRTAGSAPTSVTSTSRPSLKLADSRAGIPR